MFPEQKERARKKGKPKISSSASTSTKKRSKKRKKVEDRNVVEMTDIPWEQTVLEEDAKTHQPTSDDAPTHKPNTEDSFINNRQPKYKDAKAADKVSKVPECMNLIRFTYQLVCEPPHSRPSFACFRSASKAKYRETLPDSRPWRRPDLRPISRPTKPPHRLA